MINYHPNYFTPLKPIRVQSISQIAPFKNPLHSIGICDAK